MAAMWVRLPESGVLDKRIRPWQRGPVSKRYHVIPAVRVNQRAKHELLIFNDPGLMDCYVNRSDVPELIRRLKRFTKKGKKK